MKPIQPILSTRAREGFTYKFSADLPQNRPQQVRGSVLEATGFRYTKNPLDTDS